ncbi:MCE family protein [Microcoleus sp. FACHB-1515]|uniref:MlaD family protein n=1 Tax=Cyanophyceae TaxID=3028117 RepID=UPI0016883FF2|nr:MlaD family protein [Microcoleus sp. FACHB-1515]MBD2088476.1 MCE family protein [Microcoleus sp. FACHB-1515]
MQSSRTIREGSVGLLILVSVGLFTGLVLWVRGASFGNRNYHFVAQFANIAGMQVGAQVRYRGVAVGRISEIRPGTNTVDAELEISPVTTLIPKDVLIEINQSGLVGEASIDITPRDTQPLDDLATNPLAENCANSPIICDGDRIPGTIGVSFTELLRSSARFAELFTNEQFVSEIRSLTRNSSEAAVGITSLTREVSGLARSLDRQINTLSTSASASTAEVGRAANQVGLTAAQVNNLLATNRTTLVSTLNNLDRASSNIERITNNLTPVFDQFGQDINQSEFIANLEQLSANAAQASNNLRDLTQAVGSSDNVLLLQQTLDSARATFQNAQKITADLDELTGDPEFRRDIRDLVDGLSGLVATTQQLERQAQIAQTLTPVAIALQAQPTPTPSVAPVPTTPVSPTASPSSSLTVSPTVQIHPFDPRHLSAEPLPTAN